jgi:hypothetical protein
MGSEMAKAHIKLPDGTNITIEGDTQEVAELVRKVQSVEPQVREKPARKVRESGGNSSLPDLLHSLKDGGFFKKPKDLAEVKMALAELGAVYPTTTVAPALLRLTKARHLRRIRQDQRWFYTG